MTCQWDRLMRLLPVWMQRAAGGGRETLQELRLRAGQPLELIQSGKYIRTDNLVTPEEITFCVNMASRYSPWAAETMHQGYLTAAGGHRIGICGSVVYKERTGAVNREITSLCIRVARDYPGISQGISLSGSALILGAPGWGKTTLLRDLSRNLAEEHTVAVVDERCELFPEGFRQGKRMDVLSGIRKPDGIDRMLRTMGPEVIVVDEITAAEDCAALAHAAMCGVRLLATAHAGSLKDFYSRPVYRLIAETELFDQFLVLRQDKSFFMERRRP